MHTPQPETAQSLFSQAVALHRAGRTKEAIKAYQGLIRLNPRLVECHANLGNLLSSIGQHEEAVKSCSAAVALSPDVPEAHYNLGNALKAGGRLDEAGASYREALARRPDFPAALYSLGNVFFAQGRSADAIAVFSRAVELQPSFAQAHNNLGILRFRAEDYPQARRSFELSLKFQPRNPAVHNNLGMALQKLKMFAEAEACFRAALQLRSDYPEALEQLGYLLLEMRRTDEAFEQFRILASIRPPVIATPPDHKMRHDAEQSAYLGRPIARSLHIDGGSRVSGSTINPGNDAQTIEHRWRDVVPQILVIDDLLTPEALAELRRFCLNSSIWNEIFDDGYLGSRLQSGFACPLLAQIAEDLARGHPAIFADHPLLFAWAFKYDQAMRGTKIHADFAAVNVNFWITPDSANQNPDRGGLILWDRAAPEDWDFARYNADESAIRDFLRDNGAVQTCIPYRANRAVIFDSDLFHETDEMLFADGYENRRINITLLYGVRERAR